MVPQLFDLRKPLRSVSAQYSVEVPHWLSQHFVILAPEGNRWEVILLVWEYLFHVFCHLRYSFSYFVGSYQLGLIAAIPDFGQFVFKLHMFGYRSFFNFAQ